MYKFQYPADIVTRLRSAWTETRWREPVPKPLPPDEVLLTLIETCFHASFTSDERRGTQFKVVFCGPEDTMGNFVFARPVRFDPHELMRIAPAAESSLIGVNVGAEGEEAAIWGFAHVPLHGHLIVNVSGPGTLQIRRHGGTILALQGGHMHDSWSPPVTTGLIADLFPDAFAAFFATIRRDRVNEVHWRTFFHYRMLSLFERVAAHGHGGTLLVVPDATLGAGDWRRFVRVKYACDDDGIWSDLLKISELHNAEDEATRSSLIDANHADHMLEQKIDAAARMTRVDGALIITDRLRILGFGAEVVAPPDVEIVRVGAGCESVDAYGTRHRSAFRMCKAAPEVTAFVCSQDGGIKCVRSVDGEVVLLR